MPLIRVPRRPIALPTGATEPSSLAREAGLAFLVLPSLGTTDIVRGLAMSSGAGTRTTEASTFGVARKLAVGADIYADAGTIDPRTGYAWLLHGRFTALATWGGIFSRTKDDGTTQGLAWQRSSSTDTLNVYHDASSGVAMGTVSALLSSDVATIMGLYRPTLNVLELWRNGRLMASGTLTTAPGFTAGVGQLKIGSSRDGSLLSAELGLEAFFTRPVSSALASALTRDPLLLLRNANRFYTLPPPPLTQPVLSNLSTTAIGANGARHSLNVALP